MDTVKRAAALLDRAKPGWENLIDTETLDLNGPTCKTDCILGQIYGDYYRGLDVLADEFPGVWGVECGVGAGREYAFIGPADQTERWLVQIMNRRTMVSINTTEKVAA